MTDKIKKTLFEYEVFLRVNEDIKEEPDTDDEGNFITNSWEWDGGTWLWEKDDNGEWHRTGFRQDLFDKWVKECVDSYKKELENE